MNFGEMMRLWGVYLLLGAFLSPVAAGEVSPEPGVETPPTEVGLKARLTDALRAFDPELRIDSLSPSPLPGIYQVLVGTEVLYVTEDGHFVLRGELYDLNERRNLTDEAASRVRAKILKGLSAKDYIEFAAAEPRHIMYVFTDVDCGYCRRMHAEIQDFNDLGFTVRYLAFPRSGVHSVSGKEMHRVWCASDRKRALTLAKQGQSFETKGCRSPIAEQYKLGNALGMWGTPGIFLEDGRYIPGYRPPQTMLLEAEGRVPRGKGSSG